MKNGKELYCPKGRRGSKGEPAVPPNLNNPKNNLYYDVCFDLFFFQSVQWLYRRVASR